MLQKWLDLEMEITQACCVKALKSFGPGPSWSIKEKKKKRFIVFPSAKFKLPQTQFWSIQAVANAQQHENSIETNPHLYWPSSAKQLKIGKDTQRLHFRVPEQLKQLPTTTCCDFPWVNVQEQIRSTQLFHDKLIKGVKDRIIIRDK